MKMSPVFKPIVINARQYNQAVRLDNVLVCQVCACAITTANMLYKNYTTGIQTVHGASSFSLFRQHLS